MEEGLSYKFTLKDLNKYFKDTKKSDLDKKYRPFRFQTKFGDSELF